MNPEFKELADDLYHRRVLRARAMTVEERLLEALELQDCANAMMRGSVKLQFPDASESEVDRITLERKRRLRSVSDRGIYRTIAA